MTKRLKLKYHKLPAILHQFTFNFDLRRYIKIKPISIEELTSVTLDDLMNAWMVFAVVGGMFGGTFFLAVGPGGYRLPRHPTYFGPSSLELHGIL
jgi:hypothetical protein